MTRPPKPPPCFRCGEHDDPRFHFDRCAALAPPRKDQLHGCSIPSVPATPDTGAMNPTARTQPRPTAFAFGTRVTVPNEDFDPIEYERDEDYYVEPRCLGTVIDPGPLSGEDRGHVWVRLDDFDPTYTDGEAPYKPREVEIAPAPRDTFTAA